VKFSTIIFHGPFSLAVIAIVFSCRDDSAPSMCHRYGQCWIAFWHL